MADSFPPIQWRVYFRSTPETVWEAWTTDAGRERFWAKTSQATADGFALHFSKGQVLPVRVHEAISSLRFVFSYFNDSRVTIELTPDGGGGCVLCLTETGVPREEHLANYAGWVSVLLTCKAAVDFDVDLRSHDPARTWDDHYIDV